MKTYLPSLTGLSPGQMKAMSEKAKQARADKYLEDSRKRLDKIITTKMRTTFIGALQSFEDYFGELWGHGIAEEDFTDEQRQLRDVWEQTRTEILNKSNGQLRALKTELANHEIHWNRYTMDLPAKPLDKGEYYEEGRI